MTGNNQTLSRLQKGNIRSNRTSSHTLQDVENCAFPETMVISCFKILMEHRAFKEKEKKACGNGPSKQSKNGKLEKLIFSPTLGSGQYKTNKIHFLALFG